MDPTTATSGAKDLRRIMRFIRQLSSAGGCVCCRTLRYLSTCSYYRRCYRINFGRLECVASSYTAAASDTARLARRRRRYDVTAASRGDASCNGHSATRQAQRQVHLLATGGEWDQRGLCAGRVYEVRTRRRWRSSHNRRLTRDASRRQHSRLAVPSVGRWTSRGLRDSKARASAYRVVSHAGFDSLRSNRSPKFFAPALGLFILRVTRTSNSAPRMTVFYSITCSCCELTSSDVSTSQLRPASASSSMLRSACRQIFVSAYFESLSPGNGKHSSLSCFVIHTRTHAHSLTRMPRVYQRRLCKSSISYNCVSKTSHQSYVFDLTYSLVVITWISCCMKKVRAEQAIIHCKSDRITASAYTMSTEASLIIV